MKVRTVSTISGVAADSWNALLREDHPLLEHAVLLAMEDHGCLSEATGWLPRYLLVEEQGELVAAMPLYEKHNSWGEFVFDHAWADAYMRCGVAYYPKLVSSIPFSPIFAQKLLVAEGRERELYPVLLQGARQLAEDVACSSLHILFPSVEEQGFFQSQGLIERHDCQYHWHNRGYQDFEQFLSVLKQKKRKNIRQERRRVRDAGIIFHHLTGANARSKDWAEFTRFYNSTYDRKWGAPVFNQGFFEAAAAALGERMLLVLAYKEKRPVAGALMYRSSRVLYGRHWGCSEYYDALHFETCYYQGIEYCIEQGLELFEPGAQGVHKLARGFEPTLTHSAHWLADQRFVPAIRRFCEDESEAVTAVIRSTRAHSAYREQV